MVFEEFFLKKKIDLAQLQEAEPDLFTQFRSHFNQMGEKSFDHTKKYWFNKLRRVYPLSVEEETRLKAAFAEAKAVATEDKVSKESEPSEIVNAKPAGFKPKFKAAAPPAEDTQLPPTEISEPKETGETAKPAFKPRFKPGMAKPPLEPETAKEETPEQQETKAPAPTGFKPRFKAAVAAPKKEEAGIESGEVNTPEAEAESVTAKPTGFKPRFKPGVTKKAEEEPKVSEPEKEAAPLPVTSKPSGFKPRFKAGVTGKGTEAEPAIESKTELELPPRQIEDISEVSEDKVKPSSVESSFAEPEAKEEQAANKPLGFKPRFKAGVTGKKTEEAENITPKEPEPELPPRQIEDPSDASEDKVSPAPAQPSLDESETTIEPVTKPLGFKPRFKAGKTK